MDPKKIGMAIAVLWLAFLFLKWLLTPSDPRFNLKDQ